VVADDPVAQVRGDPNVEQPQVIVVRMGEAGQVRHYLWGRPPRI
jgi:hypothetical protein